MSGTSLDSVSPGESSSGGSLPTLFFGRGGGRDTPTSFITAQIHFNREISLPPQNQLEQLFFPLRHTFPKWRVIHSSPLERLFLDHKRGSSPVSCEILWKAKCTRFSPPGNVLTWWLLPAPTSCGQVKLPQLTHSLLLALCHHPPRGWGGDGSDNPQMKDDWNQSFEQNIFLKFPFFFKTN